MKPINPWDAADTTHHYMPAVKTDISVSIRREKARLKAKEEARLAAEAEVRVKVKPIKIRALK